MDSIARHEVYLAKIEGTTVGYLIFNRDSFFGLNFVWLLFTSPDYRRKGVTTALFNFVESFRRGQKLFTSTNESNKIMQNLLAKQGYVRCGYVEHIDENDPEIFFMKRISSNR